MSEPDTVAATGQPGPAGSAADAQLDGVAVELSRVGRLDLAEQAISFDRMHAMLAQTLAETAEPDQPRGAG